MAANYDLPGAVEKRVRFFDGQFLQDQDFIDEQKYHLDRERRHHRVLHTAGIADGLTVTAGAANQVTVAPGTAVDSDGRALVLAQATTVDLPAEKFNDKQGVELYLSYQESAEDRQTAAGSADYTRWLERPQLFPIAPGEAYAGATPPVLLATLALDGAGRVTVDTTARQYSGLRLPGPAADAPVLQTASSGRVDLSGSLTVDGDVGIGTASPAARLDVAGAADTPGQASLLLRSGNSAANFSSDQLTLGYNNTAQYRHAIKTRHHGGQIAGNAIDFYVWNYSTQSGAPDRVGGLHTMTLDGGNVGIGTTSPQAKLQVRGGAVQLDGDQQLLFTDGDTSNNLKVRLWSGYGLGINPGTLFYAANGRHSWRDNSGANERMALTTAADGGLTVNGTGASSFAGGLGVGTSRPAARLSVVQAGATEIAGTAQSGVVRITAGALGTASGSEVVLSSTGLAVNNNMSLGVRALRTTTGSDWRTAAIGLGMDVDNTVRAGAALFLHANGNVGVGTATPGAKLEVVGGGGVSVDLVVNGRLRSNNNDGGLWVASDRFVGGFNTNQIGLYNGNAWRLTVLNNGNVGIGTTSPNSDLEIGSFEQQNRYLTLKVAGGNQYRSGIKLWTWQENYGYSIEYDERGATGNGLHIRAHNLNADGTTRVFVGSDGNVGVGTTAPAAKLAVSATTNHLQLRREASETAGGKTLFLELYQDDPRNVVPEVAPSIRFHHNNKYWYRIEAQRDGFHFKEGNLPGDGYVSIKTGDLWCTGQMYFHPGYEWGPEGVFGPDQKRYWYLFRGRWNYNNFAEGGIGVKATGVTFPSDLRLKDGVAVISGALDKVGRLRGVSFSWNELALQHLTRDIQTTVSAGPDATDEENQTLWRELRERGRARLAGAKIGLVAQDVEAVLPELVQTDAEGYKRVDYSRLTAVLVQAVNEQQAVIDGLAARLAMLEREPGRRRATPPTSRPPVEGAR